MAKPRKAPRKSAPTIESADVVLTASSPLPRDAEDSTTVPSSTGELATDRSTEDYSRVAISLGAPEEQVPDEAQIRARAYELYLGRGVVQGDALSDWFTAERELRSRNSPLRRAEDSSITR